LAAEPPKTEQEGVERKKAIKKQRHPATRGADPLPVTWTGKSDLSASRGKSIWLRFRLKHAKLFSIRAGD
jgi:hypothetical protein